ncbi:hypothetical protein SERLA73DRAFT_138650 [Serpula lacrymans var. lacrymans S7.3]|uniref:Uncharacterized protein n=1 Tax=Serpula lacrymans var. lacrymans (strain S7.3) TaxID=936435 RepID=F8PZH6_SERL3|nr:hypothetical protein SERLA73DRAFT_138650 [Serpula lacrymans var. lacrymans S7.3]
MWKARIQTCREKRRGFNGVNDNVRRQDKREQWRSAHAQCIDDAKTRRDACNVTIATRRQKRERREGESQNRKPVLHGKTNPSQLSPDRGRKQKQ